jgi:hypothetical protein
MLIKREITYPLGKERRTKKKRRRPIIEIYE